MHPGQEVPNGKVSPAIACQRFARSVSVVIPCFNVAHTLTAALQSAQLQSDIDLEILCVNDGSDDSTASLLSSFASKGLIRFIDLRRTGGASTARNVGWRFARGDAVQFLDADDILFMGKIRRQLDILNESGADFVAGAYEFQSLAGNLSTHFPDSDSWAGLLLSKLGRTSSNLFRSSALRRIKGWAQDQQSSQEYELMYRLLKARAAVACDQVVGARLYARQRSISNIDVDGNLQRFLDLRQRAVNHLQRANMLTDYRKDCYDSIRRRLADL